MEYHTENAGETQEVGRKVGASLKGGEILAFSGELGAGKTTFIQGLAQGIGINARIISPTFILMRRYALESKENLLGRFFYHVDLYRLEKNFGEELENLGIPDIWGKTDSIVAIEWAEKVEDLLPENTIWIRINQEGEKRTISIQK